MARRRTGVPTPAVAWLRLTSVSLDICRGTVCIIRPQCARHSPDADVCDAPRRRSAIAGAGRRERDRGLSGWVTPPSIPSRKHEVPELVFIEPVIFLCGTFAAAFVTSLSGFAFAMVAAAIWLYALPPVQASALIAAYALLVQGYAVWKLRRLL